ncbi:capsular polysaccharide biosynthesis protein [Oceanimonas pelagia]|uniref:Capsular polysaccharide biosynthesis protein n=1 Tax=Oceanimonas pelagia TaxID=3028314 RepID=A0AA50KLI4_9GAMM|nr:capsular polysaccharide biosynthesis protein [Oceanimonas pelagia]WMC09237.1 capsular polysaccharide biosynthesis protein [Oceanimonas pelagia]
MLLTTSFGIWRQRRVLNVLLAPHSLGLMPDNSPAAVVGWGMKPNTERARRLAERRALPFWQLEDGFIGYIGHPAGGGHRLSLIVDKVGVYYDATRPSALEHMLQSLDWWNDDWQQRAGALRQALVEHGITKYNCYAGNTLPAAVATRLDNARPRVLVIDQTRGDQSVRLGLASEQSFANMLTAAKAENPGAQIIVRTHPDVLLGKKLGYLNDVGDDVLLLADSVNPFALMAQVDKVYTVTSQLGFEALLAGKPVVCFGAPFYAGWGVTDDRIAVPRRGEPRTVPQLLAAAYLRYCRYLDPITGERCELEDVLDLILAQRSPVPPVDELYAVGFSLWRRRFAPRFLSRYARKVTFVNRIPDAMDSRFRGNDNKAVLVWGRRFESQLANCPLPVWRMEDGFLRSVGLGSDLRRPGSLVIDPVGIYYDPRTPSAIEHYLGHHDFSSLELSLGEQLLTHFREQALTKYNVGTRSRLDWRKQANGRPVLLVPGQVDDDASVQLGSPFVAGNAALLQAVRAAHPNAFIIFKPHPDVVSGNRKGQVPEKVLKTCVDLVETDAGIVDCLDACDTVHVLTSLTGLEALIRGKPVTVWSQPFYAGWGLTTDVHPVARRGRALPLPALVYATYAWYPTYVDYQTGLCSTPQRFARQLAREREQFKEPDNRVLRLVHRRLRKARFLWEALAPLGSFKR